VYYKTKAGPRLVFQSKQTREANDPTTAELGPSIDLYMKRWVRLKEASAYQLDEAKARPILFSIGYRYLPPVSSPPKNRLETFLTSNFALKGKILLSDRNRADLDWQNGVFTWQYRNRLQLERTVSIRSYHFSPYVSAEPFYLSKYHKWSDTALYAGCLIPIRRHTEFNPYYEHQNNTGKHPNEQLDQLGLMLSLHF
jgi:hypothetical protein